MPPPNKKRLYVGCAINGLLPEHKAKFLADIARLKNRLREHFEVLDFLGSETADPKDTFRRDIYECVFTADCLLAIADHPSTGLGFEMGAAIWGAKIPVLAMAHAQRKNVSKIVQGAYGIPYEYVTYRSFREIPEIAHRILTRMMRSANSRGLASIG